MNPTKCILSTIVLLVCCGTGYAQEKLLRKSWIKASLEDFTEEAQASDTMYMRYVFNNGALLFGVEPAWHYTQVPYAMDGKLVKIGYDQWTIETLTDTTLTIFLNGFRRIRFYAEDYLLSKVNGIRQIGEHNGKPLYEANGIVTPRYKKPNSLINDVKSPDLADEYNIQRPATFAMSFVVTDEGKVENAKIIAGVAHGFDNEIMKGVLKTSKKWSPATFKGSPIQTLMFLEFHIYGFEPGQSLD